MEYSENRGSFTNQDGLKIFYRNEIYNEREGQRAKVLHDLEVWIEAHI